MVYQNVVYQNHVYALRTTIINNRTTYIDARSYVHQDQRHGFNTTSAPAPVAGVSPPGFAVARAAAVPAAAANPRALSAFSGSATPAPSPAQFYRAPDYAHLSAPHFNAQMLQPGRPVALHASSPPHAASVAAVSNPMRQVPAALHASGLQAPPSVPRPAMKPEPQQHAQRMASFTPPRAAVVRSADPHPQRPHPSAQPQHHDHRQDS